MKLRIRENEKEKKTTIICRCMIVTKRFTSLDIF